MVVLRRHGQTHSCAEQRGSSARADADSTQTRRFPVRAGTDLPCGFALKIAETRRRTSCATTLKDRETRCKDCSNYHCKNRTYLDMKY